MQKIKLRLRENVGIFWCVLFYLCFAGIARAVRLDGANWYFFSSAQRAGFGLAELAVFVKLFHKEKWTNVIHFKHFKDGLRAGSGLVVYTAVIAVVVAVGAVSLIDTTFAILFSCLICQQVTTGFWEELTFRAFLLEGYFQRVMRSRFSRFAYAGISFLIFGLIHAIECDNFEDAAVRLLTTGAYGFVFAAVYLYSHNILVSMLLHFVYDIAANFPQFVAVWDEESTLFHVMNDYVSVAVYVCVLISSVIFVWKEPVYGQEEQQRKKIHAE